MIRVVFFDLGGTLIDSDRRPFPGVKTALATIGEFKAANGKPLLSCLVSDFDMVVPPITSAKVKPIFERYLSVLDAAGLRSFFEPVDRRITLSTHAGASKPAKAIFDQALKRLRSNARLNECLLITENREHIEAARQKLKMSSLQFGTSEGPQEAFDDWAAAPAIVARLLGTPGANAQSLLRAGLARDGIEVDAAEQKTPLVVAVSGKVWHPISIPGRNDLKDLHVAIPVQGTVRLRDSGEIEGSDFAAPSPEQIDEARSFVASLADHGQIAERPGSTSGRATHAIETDAQGRRKLVRKGFSVL